MAAATSAPFSEGSTLGGAGVAAGVGPVVLRTVSCGAAVSARLLVMLVVGEAAGGSLRVGCGWGCGRVCDWGWASDVCRLEGSAGRTMGRWFWDDEVKAGEAGGVWVEARGRV